MGAEGIIPVMNMNDNCNGWGNGNGWGALVGGAVGGAVGSAWNGNRWNNNGGNCGCGCSGSNFGQELLMDNLTALGANVNSIGRDQMLQTAGIQSTLCQGFAGVNATVNNVAAQAAQNQSRTEAAVLTTGLNGQLEQKNNTIAQLQASHAAEVQGMRSSFDLISAIKECCCTTNRNIEVQSCAIQEAVHREGEATRAQAAQIEKDHLLRELCSKDAKIGQLENQAFSTQLAQQTLSANQGSMNQMLATILNAIPKTAASGGAAA